MPVDYRRPLIALVSIAFFVLAAVPAIVVFSQGWLPMPRAAVLSDAPPPDGGSPEAWTLFALFYLVWMAADVLLLVYLYGRIGFHYTPTEVKPRQPRQTKRRRTATMRYMAGQEQARADAASAAARARRRTSRPAEPDPMEGRPPRKPPSERGRRAKASGSSEQRPSSSEPPQTPRSPHDFEESA